MRLRISRTVIALNGFRAVLRPTLGAAFALEGRYGFPELLKGIAEQNLGMMADVIQTGSGDTIEIYQILQSLNGKTLRSGFEHLIEPLCDFVMQLAGIDDAEPGEKTGEPIPYGEFHLRLYRIATGWLGWSPEQAWNASPAEIIEAQNGRIEILQAIFGKRDDKSKDVDRSELSLDDKFKLAFMGGRTRVENAE